MGLLTPWPLSEEWLDTSERKTKALFYSIVLFSNISPEGVHHQGNYREEKFINESDRKLNYYYLQVILISLYLSAYKLPQTCFNLLVCLSAYYIYVLVCFSVTYLEKKIHCKVLREDEVVWVTRKHSLFQQNIQHPPNETKINHHDNHFEVYNNSAQNDVSA